MVLHEGFTHIEEGAGVLQYELTGVWFVFTVIDINVKLISLEKRKTIGEEKCLKFYTVILS